MPAHCADLAAKYRVGYDQLSDRSAAKPNTSRPEHIVYVTGKALHLLLRIVAFFLASQSRVTGLMGIFLRCAD